MSGGVRPDPLTSGIQSRGSGLRRSRLRLDLDGMPSHVGRSVGRCVPEKSDHRLRRLLRHRRTPKSVMKSRRCMCPPQGPRLVQGLKASTMRPQCPLWVISGHFSRKRCLLYPQTRTSGAIRGDPRNASARDGLLTNEGRSTRTYIVFQTNRAS